MSESQIVPWIAAVAAVATTLYVAVSDRPVSKLAWVVPGGLSLLFFLVSLRTLLVEGPTGFWAHHTQDLWGNQVWFDLLLGVSAALTLMIPRARKMHMSVLPWVLVSFATGSIGLYAFISRLLYLESRKPAE